ncbi:penicillin acylase family protein [Nocardiopsis gilva YIM 90087]|uniref:Penicillin acylase family protein n=1 Tax=Nocardiopsis gilva YIM 90087 TaxID=1235441 RepID=A0A223S4X4_9ACTN|nr:penicillin acylase family protein [Nocardiopsis gilva]ASU83158.1 penicillin acylase family protein [Nocardiopsis gilva YIM 90087]
MRPKGLLAATLLTGVALIATTLTTMTAGAAPAPHHRSPKISGLREPVRILRDTWGVPHIYAKNTEDLFLAQGYAVAQDRLFQIDLWRRRGLGRLSEVLGEKYVKQDRAARLFLYRGDMDEEWASYGPETKMAATRFTEGINAYIDVIKDDPDALPKEFRDLGYTPAKWKPEDVVRIRSHALANNFYHEVSRSYMSCWADPDAHKFQQKLEAGKSAKVPEGFEPCALPHQDDPLDFLETYVLGTQPVTINEDGEVGLLGMKPGSSEGSNSWAIAPERTSTGRPILAGDPHRAMSAPSLRYITHLSAPGLDVIGAGEPALPGVSMGHNGKIAFGLTIFTIDQEDLYVYELDPDDPTRYRYGDGWEKMRTEEEKVEVKGAESHEAELRFTRHGPVIFTDTDRNLAYAVRSVWLEPGTSPYYRSMRLMRAQNFAEFQEGMRGWGTPPLNFTYADTDGNIGWQPGGLTPKRVGYDGLMPVPGDGRYEWDGFVDPGNLPSVYNPKSGFFATANEFNISDEQAAVYGYEWQPPYRHERISEVLSANRCSSLEDSMALQNDQVSIPARRIAALLRGLESDDPQTAAALKLLRSWDGTVGEDSPQAALFEPWFMRHLGPAVVAEAVSEQMAEIIVFADSGATMIDLLQDPEPWFGADGEAVRDRILLSSLKSAYADVSDRLGSDTSTWKWGDIQQTTFTNPTGEHLGPFPRGGSPHTVNASNYNWETFEQTSGASFKMVLDVGNWDASRAINAPGQSGDPSSPHYADLLPAWRKGEYFPLLYSRDAVERNTASTTHLRP